MSSSSGVGRPRAANAGTFIAGAEEEHALVLAGLAGLESARRNADALAGALVAHGHRIVAAGPASIATTTLGARACDFVVVGRHTESDFVLDAPAVSLRHALVIPFEQRESCGVEVLALDPGLPLVLPDGTRAPALRIEGEGSFVIGPYALHVVPLEGPAGRAAVATAKGLATANVPKDGLSLVRGTTTRVGTFTDVGQLRSRRSGEPIEAVVVLRQGSRVARVELTHEDLAHGVLLGRYADRCFDASLHAVLCNDRISRVHLLLRKSGASLALFDTASTNGTWAHGERVHYLAIDGGNLEVELGARHDPVHIGIEYRPR